MNRLFKLVDSYLIPIILLSTWLLMFASAKLRGLPAIAALLAFGVVVVLWASYRELRAHAAASRHAAQGEPEELLALADAQLARRWTVRSRIPFHLYRSIAHHLRGDRAAARDALDAADLSRIHTKAGRSWRILHAAQRIALLADTGDAAEARRILERELQPQLRFVPGAGADVIATEAEARVLVAEGRPADALPRLERLARDVRLGPAPRAVAHLLRARCLPEPAASEARADAARLAPKVSQNLPSTETPAPSAET